MTKVMTLFVAAGIALSATAAEAACTGSFQSRMDIYYAQLEKKTIGSYTWNNATPERNKTTIARGLQSQVRFAKTKRCTAAEASAFDDLVGLMKGFRKTLKQPASAARENALQEAQDKFATIAKALNWNPAKWTPHIGP